MRKRTLASVCSGLGLLVVLAMGVFHVKTPHNIPFFVIYLVATPLLSVALAPFNKRLLAWRKKRGRDVDEEEKYEIEEAGIISLRPRPESASRKN
ncbi:MAG: hypothetical protein QOH70_2443 [Blastocatellia bacterium]|jgi:hypothetical protein|nr:hypothetical protein [Blastocatellia bacterium]